MKIFGEIKDKTDRKMRRIEKVALGVLAVVLTASLSIGAVAAIYFVSEVSIQTPENEEPSATPEVADSIDPVLKRAKDAMPDYRPKDDKGPGQPEATPRVTKPETDTVEPYHYDPNHASYEIRKYSGSGENDGDKMTVQVFWENGGSIVTDYVLSSGVWVPILSKEFDTAKKAEEYLAGQNNGPTAEPE